MSSHLLRMLGRGSTLPGKIALQIDKDILQHLGQNYENCGYHWYEWENTNNSSHCWHSSGGFRTDFNQSKRGQYDLWDYNDLLTG